MEVYENERIINERELVYLLLHEKDCLKKFIQMDIKADDFDEENRPVVLSILETYEQHNVLLTRKSFREKIKTNPVPKERIAQELAFNSCYSATAQIDDFPMLVQKIVDCNVKHKAIRALETYAKANKKDGDIIALRELVNSCEKILSRTDNSEYSNLYQEFLQCRDFPIDIFPEEIKTALYQFRKKNGCSIDYVANAFLTCVAMANGTKVMIMARGKKADSKLWCMSVGTSSKGKSDGAKDIVVYYRQLDDAAKVEYDEEMLKHVKKEIVYKTKVSSLSRKKGIALTQNDIPDKPIEPKRKEHVFKDGTVEAMNRIVADNPDGSLLYIDDFFGWYSQLCKFSNATAAGSLASLQQYYDSEFDETIKQSRAKQKDSLNISKHYLCIYGNIQPDLIQRTLFHNDLRDSGFIHRLLFFYPDGDAYSRPAKDTYAIPRKHKETVFNLYDNLRGSEYGSGEWSDYLTISLDNQSEEVRNLHYKAFCKLDYIEQHTEKYNSVLCSHVGRHKKHLSKLILNLHLLDCCVYNKDVNIIEIKTVKSAIRLSFYYISHFLKLYEMFLKKGKKNTSIKSLGDHDRILNSITEGKALVRDIQTSTKIPSDKIRSILKQLEKDGVGTCQVSEQGRNKGQVSGFVKS